MGLKVENIEKSFQTTRGKKVILKNFSYMFEREQIYILSGRSGCGKTTLLQILGLLSVPNMGNVYMNHSKIDFYKEKELSRIRNQKIGYVTQNYTLVPDLTVYENIQIPMIIGKKKQL